MAGSAAAMSDLLISFIIIVMFAAGFGVGLTLGEAIWRKPGRGN